MIGAVVRRGAEPLPGIRTEVSAGPGDETRCARRLLEAGAERVIAVGGDGFIRGVAAGFFDGRRNRFPKAALAIVPAGTGNDVARLLRIPRDGAIDGPAAPFDVGFLNDAPFLNIAQVGVGACAVEAANAWGKPRFGKLGYWPAAVWGIMRRSSHRMTIEADGESIYAGVASNVIIANGRTYGGGMLVAPNARQDDGLLDVMVIRPVRPGEVMALLSRTLRGVPENHPQVLTRRVRRLRIESSSPAEADGDVLARGPVEIGIEPGALQVVRAGE